MIVSMPTTARRQQRHDHRLRNLVHRTADVTVTTDLDSLEQAAGAWLGTELTVVVCLAVVDLTEPEAPTRDPEADGDASRSSRRCSGSPQGRGPAQRGTGSNRPVSLCQKSTEAPILITRALSTDVGVSHVVVAGFYVWLYVSTAEEFNALYKSTDTFARVLPNFRIFERRRSSSFTRSP